MKKGAPMISKTMNDAGEHHLSLCRTPDEADAEDEHADCQHHCANIGQIDAARSGPVRRAI